MTCLSMLLFFVRLLFMLCLHCEKKTAGDSGSWQSCPRCEYPVTYRRYNMDDGRERIASFWALLTCRVNRYPAALVCCSMSCFREQSSHIDCDLLLSFCCGLLLSGYVTYVLIWFVFKSCLFQRYYLVSFTKEDGRYGSWLEDKSGSRSEVADVPWYLFHVFRVFQRDLPHYLRAHFEAFASPAQVIGLSICLGIWRLEDDETLTYKITSNGRASSLQQSRRLRDGM